MAWSRLRSRAAENTAASQHCDSEGKHPTLYSALGPQAISFARPGALNDFCTCYFQPMRGLLGSNPSVSWGASACCLRSCKCNGITVFKGKRTGPGPLSEDSCLPSPPSAPAPMSAAALLTTDETQNRGRGHHLRDRSRKRDTRTPRNATWP